eukprot:Gb_30245 [translate_table: standard]
MVYKGDIVRNAAETGAVGVVVYLDPQDYVANGTEGYYMESKWLPPSRVQGGTMFQELGDPLTPGWPSALNLERLSDDKLCAPLPSILSLPISIENAYVIINSRWTDCSSPLAWCWICVCTGLAEDLEFSILLMW